MYIDAKVLYKVSHVHCMYKIHTYVLINRREWDLDLRANGSFLFRPTQLYKFSITDAVVTTVFICGFFVSC